MGIDRAGRDEFLNAVIDGDIGAVERLLAQGYDPNVVDRAGRSALHFTAQNNHAELTSILLKAGALHSSRDHNGNTPLSDAVFSYQGAAECVSVLLSAGADPDMVNDYGVSPRALALSIGNYDVRKLFP